MIGDEWAKAGQELGKAGQEIGKATGKGIDAAQTAGGFFGPFLIDPLKQASSILTDRLAYTRFERQVRFIQNARDLLIASGLQEPGCKVPLNFGVPLIEAATLEEDDDLQSVWAQLLVNSVNPSAGVEPRTAFIGMLKEMNSLDATILQRIYRAPEKFRDNGYVLTGGLPDRYIEHDENKRPRPSESVLLSLGNLTRLNCIERMMLMAGMTDHEVSLTPLGEAFIRAVSPPAIGP